MRMYLVYASAHPLFDSSYPARPAVLSSPMFFSLYLEYLYFLSSLPSRRTFRRLVISLLSCYFSSPRFAVYRTDAACLHCT
jgi:hypothetical protein